MTSGPMLKLFIDGLGRYADIAIAIAPSVPGADNQGSFGRESVPERLVANGAEPASAAATARGATVAGTAPGAATDDRSGRPASR